MHYEQNAYPGIHSPPSYVALNSDARTACANVIHDIVYTTIPMAILEQHILYLYSSTRSHVLYIHAMTFVMLRCMCPSTCPSYRPYAGGMECIYVYRCLIVYLIVFGAITLRGEVYNSQGLPQCRVEFKRNNNSILTPSAAISE